MSTDKVDTEIPSPEAGYLLATLAYEGEVIEVDQIIAHIGATPDEKITESTGSKTKASAQKSTPAGSSSAVSASAKASATSHISFGGFNSPVPMEAAGAVEVLTTGFAIWREITELTFVSFAVLVFMAAQSQKMTLKDSCRVQILQEFQLLQQKAKQL